MLHKSITNMWPEHINEHIIGTCFTFQIGNQDGYFVH